MSVDALATSVDNLNTAVTDNGTKIDALLASQTASVPQADVDAQAARVDSATAALKANTAKLP